MQQVPDKNDLTHTIRSLGGCVRRVKAAHGAVIADITHSSEMIAAAIGAGIDGSAAADAAARHALNGQRLLEAGHDLDAIEKHIETLADTLNIEGYVSVASDGRSTPLTQSDVDALITETEKR